MCAQHELRELRECVGFVCVCARVPDLSFMVCGAVAPIMRCIVRLHRLPPLLARESSGAARRDARIGGTARRGHRRHCDMTLSAIRFVVFPCKQYVRGAYRATTYRHPQPLAVVIETHKNARVCCVRMQNTLEATSSCAVGALDTRAPHSITHATANSECLLKR